MNNKHYGKIVALLVCALIVIAQTGCATIISGTSQEVIITSEPTGAMVKVDGLMMETPAKVTLSRKEDYVVEISKPGYHTANIKVEKTMNGWVIGNIVFGGIPGLVVDMISGGVNNLSPGDVHMNMVPTSVAAPEIELWDATSLKEHNKKNALTKE